MPIRTLITDITAFLKTARNPLIVLLGPTASGKTALSIALAKQFNGEIISADSRQIYKHINIGSAKITQKEMDGVPHHGLDLVTPDQTFSMAEFKEYAEKTIDDIRTHNHIPFLVGGTGLYINAICDNYNVPRVPANPEFRRKLEQEAAEKGKDIIYKKLEKIDPETAATIHPNNLRYVIRALEINEYTKSHKQDTKSTPQYDVYKIGINWPREQLYDRINQRVHQQIKDGLIDEAKALLARGYTETMPAISSLGCKELFPYIRGEMTLEEAIDLIQRSTRGYARRQLTWFRKDKTIHWIESADL